MNIPPTRALKPILGVRSLPLLRNKHKYPPPTTPHNLCITMGKKPTSEEHSQKHKARLGYHLVLGPLFWECPNFSLHQNLPQILHGICL